MSLRETADFGQGGAATLIARGRANLRALMHGDGDRARTGRGALTAFAIRIVGAALAYLSQALMARWMGGFEYGIFVFVWVWVLVLGGLSPLGFSIVCHRFVPEYRATGKLELLRGLLLGSRTVTLAVSTLVMACAIGALYLFESYLESYYWLPAFLILFCLPIYALVDTQDGIARGFAWINIALAPAYIARPILLLGALFLAGLAGFPLTAVTAAGCAVFAYWLTGVLQTFMLQRGIARDMGPGPRSFEMMMWLRTAMPLVLVLGFELLLQNTDILVLARYLDPSEVGYYFAALKTIGLVSFVHFAVGTAAANRFSAHNAKGEQADLEKSVREAVRWTFWPSLAGALILLALGKPLLWLFGPEFTAAYPVMFILAAGFLVRAAMGPAEFVLNMLGEQNRCAAVLSVSAVANLVLNFALVPLYGIHGAAVATALSVALAAIALYWVAKRQLGINLFVLGR